MPYRRTQFVAGEYYHLYNRGIDRQLIFLERENYLFFLRRWQTYVSNAEVELVAYCLMPNHYHLLVHLRTDDLSRLLQRLLLSYSKAFNRRYDRVGSLFEGPFKSAHVDRDEYLLHLSRYIHLNPVLAGLVAKAEDWEYSSYVDYIGLRNGTLPKPDVIMSRFGSPADYRQFVESHISADDAIISHLVLD